MRHTGWVVGFCLFVGLGGALEAQADEIRLKDGTKLSAKVIGKDSNDVIVRLSRGDVVMINGQPLPDPIGEGFAAPLFTATDLEGKTQTLTGSRSRVTLLKFWATWCPHCRNDVSLMKDLFARYRDQGLQLVTVSTDQDVQKLRSFIRDQGVGYPVIAAYDPSGSNAALPDLYEVQGIPAYYLIDEKGTIVKTFAGSFTERKFDFENLLKGFLASAKTAGEGNSAGKP